ncbi:hypothetical protein [Lysobacter xanthus]
MSQHVRTFVAALLLGLAAPSHAATLATQQLVTPLIPGAHHSATIGVPGMDPSRPVWVAYRVVGLSSSKSPTGAVHFSNSFDGIALPATDMMWRMDATDMRSGDTDSLRTQLQALAAQRSEPQLAATLGPGMHAAYKAVLTGDASSVDGRAVRVLPAPGRSDTALDVSVEGAEGVQPVLVAVTVGQGDVPAEFATATPGASAAFGLGKVLFVLMLAGALLWWWRRR